MWLSHNFQDFLPLCFSLELNLIKDLEEFWIVLSKDDFFSVIAHQL